MHITGDHRGKFGPLWIYGLRPRPRPWILRPRPGNYGLGLRLLTKLNLRQPGRKLLNRESQPGGNTRVLQIYFIRLE